ncbi:SUMF1/EgtB/PvdO family nonheme iron enzyme [Desulfococcaceae bacterium HSG8]|nr:SUMF1/EgtB/PvdO family nonheme iron enzyme [Desulfococcaceae bacterium HSG8]
MNHFPLHSFLIFLESEGLRLTIRDYDRIALALGTGGEWTITRLRCVLTALLAKDEGQRTDFLRCFDDFFDADLKPAGLRIDVQKVLAELQGFGKKDKKPFPARLRHAGSSGRTARPVAKRRFRSFLFSGGIALFVLICGLAGYKFIPYFYTGPVATTTTTTTVPESRPDVSPVPEPRIKIYPDVPVVTKIARSSMSGGDGWKESALVSALLFLLTLFYGIHLWQSRKVPKDIPPEWDKTKPRCFPLERIGGELSPRLDDASLAHLADSIGYFKSGQASRELDVPASIEATGDNAGIPALVFYKRRKIRSLIILEDMFAEALAWNPIARELAVGMSGLGVPLLYGKFRGSPEQFFTEDGRAFYLEDLETDRKGYLLLIFSDGKGIRGHGARYVMEAVARWPMTAWMELRAKESWDESAALPAHYGIPLYPATADGLLCAFGRFMTERAPQEDYSEAAGNWQGIPPQGNRDLSEYLEAMLGDALLLAQACAMIQPVTLGMADAVRREFHPELPSERIGRLTAVPGTTRNAAGLRFSDSVLAILRPGFVIRRGEEEQVRVLNFLLKKLDDAEPAEKGSPAHLTWKWMRERVRLELEPDDALKCLSELSRTPLEGTIKGDMENVVSEIPLREMPGSKDGRQRLGAIARNSGISTLEVYPVARRSWAVLGMLVLCVFISLWRCGYEYLNRPGGQLAFANAGNTDARVRLDVRDGETWKTGVSQAVSPALKLPLKTGREYRVTLFGSGYFSAKQSGIIKRNEESLEASLGSAAIKAERVFTEPVTETEFVWIPGGCFEMGQTEEEKADIIKERGEEKYKYYADELPRHKVCLDGFWMAKYEVSNARYRKFRPDHNSGEYKGNSLNGDDQPAVEVSWEDANAFIKWLNRENRGNYEFRLPTEAEWEYACRAGTTTSRFWGDNPDQACRYANVADQTAKQKFNDWTIHNCDDGYAVTAPVGSFGPNDFGLHDMLGNIWEWCEDIYADDAYSKQQRNNPIYMNGGSNRVYRGGSWLNVPANVRCAVQLLAGRPAQQPRVPSREDPLTFGLFTFLPFAGVARAAKICHDALRHNTPKGLHNTPKGLNNIAQGQRSATLGTKTQNDLPRRGYIIPRRG